jgi:excisionase family DNA binding protein
MIKDLLATRRDLVMRLADIDAEIMGVLVAGQQDVRADDRLLDVGEAAARLSVKPSYLYELIRRDVVPVVRIGKLIRLRLTTIIEIETGKRRLS